MKEDMGAQDKMDKLDEKHKRKEAKRVILLQYYLRLRRDEIIDNVARELRQFYQFPKIDQLTQWFQISTFIL